MAEREMHESIEETPYFEAATLTVHKDGLQDTGVRDMEPLPPFIISGGENTERYYFKHVNAITKYKFTVVPEYFGNESNYTEEFPKRIKRILEKNNDAHIFCVFDWDTINENDTCKHKHELFLSAINDSVQVGLVTICESMPSIEYWFLLHFVNETKLMKDWGDISSNLTPVKRCFPKELWGVRLKKLLKSQKYLEDETWVRKLSADGKLEDAIQRAEQNILKAKESNSLNKQSYTYVYKAFTSHPTI